MRNTPSRLSPRSCWPSCSRKAPVLWPTSCRPQKPFQHLVCQHTEQHPGSRLFHPGGRGDLRLLPERGRLHFPQAKVQAKTRLTNLQLWKFLRFLGSRQLRRLFPGQCAGICRKYEGKAWLEPVRRPGICLPMCSDITALTVQYLHSYYRP